MIITELMATVLFFANAFSAANFSFNSLPVTNSISQPNVLITKAPQTMEELVRDYYSETPILVEIARCESHFRHYDKNGDVMRGTTNTKDVGVMQINEAYHSDKAETLGLDIYSLDGNLEYAKYLYEKEGTKPWRSSAKCWSRELAKI